MSNRKTGRGMAGIVGYLGYVIRYVKLAEGIVCEQKALRGILAVPQKFTWTDPYDLTGARRAIEALIKGDVVYWQACLASGKVRDVVDPVEIGDTRMVRITVKNFVDFLLLRGYIDIPIDTKVVFLNNDGHKFMPAEYVAALTPLLEAAGEDPGILGDPKSWKRASLQDAANAKVSLGMYRKDHPSHHAADDPDNAAPTDLPPAEVEVRRTVSDRCADIVTEVRPEGLKPFYARRILSLNDGRMLWTGSAWSPAGPWTVASRDVSGMLSLGVQEP